MLTCGDGAKKARTETLSSLKPEASVDGGVEKGQ